MMWSVLHSQSLENLQTSKGWLRIESVNEFMGLEAQKKGLAPGEIGND